MYICGNLCNQLYQIIKVMKRRIIIVFFLVATSLLCVMNIFARNNSRTSVKSAEKELIPSWVNGSVERGLWIGMSPPIADEEHARCFAVTNAVLSYLYAVGGGVISNDVEILNHGMQQEQQYSFNEKTRVIISNLRIDIVNEYYNKRNEYVVACQIKKDKASLSALSVSKDFFYRDGETKCIVEMSLRTEFGDFLIFYDGKNSIKYLYNDEEGIINCNNRVTYNYPSVSLFSVNKKADDLYIERVESNIGWSQFLSYCYLPLISDCLDVMSCVELKAENDVVVNINTTNYKGIGVNVPLKIYLSEIKGKNMIYRIPKCELDENNTSEDTHVGLINNKIKPFWTSMQFAAYESIHVLASLNIAIHLDRENEVPYHEDVSSTNVISLSSVKIDNIEFDWGIGKESLKMCGNTPFVRVRWNNKKVAD